MLQKKQFQKYQQHQEQGINDELYTCSYLNKSRVVTTGANFIFTDTESSVTLLDFFKHLQNLEITLYSNSGKKITSKHVIMSSDLAETILTEDDVGQYQIISSPDLFSASSSRHLGTKLRVRNNVMTSVINCIKPLGAS